MAQFLKLESFTERRSICTHPYLPKNGNTVGSIRQLNFDVKNPFDPWAIRFQDTLKIPKFVATEFEIAIPNSETVVRCERCHGNGEIQCVNCITYGAIEVSKSFF